MWKLLGTPKAAAVDSNPDAKTGTPQSHGPRGVGASSAVAGRTGSQSLQRPDQESGALLQLCERISAFVFGEYAHLPLLVDGSHRVGNMIGSLTTLGRAGSIPTEQWPWEPQLCCPDVRLERVPRDQLRCVVQRRTLPHGKRPSTCLPCQTSALSAQLTRSGAGCYCAELSQVDLRMAWAPIGLWGTSRMQPGQRNGCTAAQHRPWSLCMGAGTRPC